MISPNIFDTIFNIFRMNRHLFLFNIFVGCLFYLPEAAISVILTTFAANHKPSHIYMKKYLFGVVAAAALLFTGCIPSQKFVSVGYAVDYTEVKAETGVMVTEVTAVPFEYEALGSVFAIAISGEDKNAAKARKVNMVSEKARDGIYGTDDLNGVAYVGKFRRATMADAVMEAARVTASMGGDVIINVKSFVEYDKNGNPTWHTTGMAIRRK